MNKSTKAVYLLIKRKFLADNKENVTVGDKEKNVIVNKKPAAASAVGEIKKSAAAAADETIIPDEQSETVEPTSFEQSFVLENEEIFTII